jgi:hypothetical protein
MLTQTTLNATTVDASGTITNTQTISATIPNFVVGTAGMSLNGGGKLALSNSASNLIIGAASGATLTNIDNVITGAGNIGGGTMTLINRVGGTINGTGGQAMTIDTGANTITNAGLIEATGTGGVTIKSAVANGGTLESNGGVLKVNRAVTGAGQAVVNGGTLYFLAAFNQAVTFTSATGVLELASSQTFKKSVTGFSHSGSSTFDLLDVGFVSAGEATYVDNGSKTGGVLTVTDGAHTAKITLVGDYTTSTFKCSSDGHGGVLVVDPKLAAAAPPPAACVTSTPLKFAQAAAKLGPAPNGPMAETTAGAPTRAGTSLARPCLS